MVKTICPFGPFAAANTTPTIGYSMSLLLFYVGNNGYAIDSQYVLKIIPYVELKKIPSMPIHFAGLLNLGGKAIPIVDFCQLIEQRSTPFLFSSRIILVKDPQSNSERLLGILGEKIKDFIDVKLEEFSPSDFSLVPFSYLNRMFNREGEMIQYLDLASFFHFLSTEVFHFIEKEDHGF